MVAEMVPEKELQPRAFSVMPLVWNLGSIFGPSFGGFFTNPVENLPALFGNSRFFKKFPFALPNIVASGFFLIGISTGILFLKVCIHLAFYLQLTDLSGNARNQKAQKRLRSGPRQAFSLIFQDDLPSTQTPQCTTLLSQTFTLR